MSGVAPAADVLAAGGPRLAGLLERAEARLAAEMAAVGLVNIRYLLTAGGIIAIHAGEVPS